MNRDDIKILAFVLIAVAIWLIFLFGVNVAG
jgi:hypothetical protein